jgi:glycosyltransferase involved in cell wall biosynthesis
MPDVEFQMIGDGPLKESIYADISRRNLNNVILRGALYDKELDSARNTSKVLVVPSECNENAPLVILEAFSAGIPVVGSNLGGIPELIENGINGFLFKPGDAEDLKEKLLVILQNEKKREEMGKCGYDKYLKYFTQESHASMMFREYLDRQPTKK